MEQTYLEQILEHSNALAEICEQLLDKKLFESVLCGQKPLPDAKDQTVVAQAAMVLNTILFHSVRP